VRKKPINPAVTPSRALWRRMGAFSGLTCRRGRAAVLHRLGAAATEARLGGAQLCATTVMRADIVRGKSLMNSSSDRPTLQPVQPSEVFDPGKVRTGMGFKVLPPAKTPEAIADNTKQKPRPRGEDRASAHVAGPTWSTTPRKPG
jgi:hypothetical protein